MSVCQVWWAGRWSLKVSEYGVQKAPGDLARTRQQERICARNTLPHDAELPIGKAREAARNGERLLARVPADLAGDPTVSAAVATGRTALDAPLADGDRVEIYRALRADPKEIRRRRASSKTAER